jgi:hypothetical protein
MIEIWDLWIPDAGATGVSFARSRVDGDVAGDRVMVHAAPKTLNVTVRSDGGTILAEGLGLEREQGGPMSFLVRQGREVRLEERWPTEDDLGRLVILPGGEAGILQRWWHAEDRSEWRWQIELYNHR